MWTLSLVCMVTFSKFTSQESFILLYNSLCKHNNSNSAASVSDIGHNVYVYG